MNIYEIMLLPLFAVVMLILPVVYILKKKKSNSAAKTAFVVNICSFFAVLALGIILPVGGFDLSLRLPAFSHSNLISDRLNSCFLQYRMNKCFRRYFR